MNVWRVWAKAASRAAHPMLEIEPNQNAGRWAVCIYTNKTRRFSEWADNARLEELLERHRGIGNTVELSRRRRSFAGTEAQLPTNVTQSFLPRID